MTADPKDWRTYLTTPEAMAFANLEKRAEAIDAERETITDRMNRIRNRCAARRRFTIGRVTAR